MLRPQLGAWLLAVAPVLLGGCRMSYELLSDGESIGLGGSPHGGGPGGSTSTGGVGNDPGASDGGTGGVLGSGGSAGSRGDFHVTTGVDELDPDATVDDPGGTGLSLREAIVLANDTPGTQTITFEPGIVVVLQSILPDITDPVHVIGDGARVDASTMSGNTDCLVITVGPTLIEGLEIHGCRQSPISIEAGSGTQVRGCSLHDNGQPLQTAPLAGPTIFGPGNVIARVNSHGISVYSSDCDVLENHVSDTSGSGVFVASGGAGARLIGNLIVRGLNGIGLGSNANGVVIWHNTIVHSLQTAVVVGQASGIDARNNILVYSGNYGLVGGNDRFAAQSHNLFFSNGLGDCSPCTVGSSSVTLDPQFADGESGNYTLLATSPAIDAGVDTGTNRNGSSPGLFNGSAPDIGFFESQ